jgi:transposase
MGFIRKKKVKKYTYYYYVEKERRDGKPVDSVHIYLGTADEILNKIKTRSESRSTVTLKTFEYGKLAALLAIDDELGFREIVDDAVSKRNENGLSVGDYILISIFGRWCGPLSKTASAKHFTESFIGFGTKFPSKVNAQNIISNMKYFDKEMISEIELELSKKLKAKRIIPDMIVWDTTNNFTFIENGEKIPQKGKSKQGRHNKNLIGMGLAVSGENIPVFHTTVPGNTHDAPLFNEIVDDIINRLRKIDVDPEGLVMVFDKGNNSEENIKKVSGKINILGSLKRNQVKDMFKIPLSEYKTLYTTDKGVEISGYTTKRELYSKEYTIVMSFNPSTRKRQILTYEKAKRKIMNEMDSIQRSLIRKGRGRPMTTKGTIKKAVLTIPNQYGTIFKYDVIEKYGKKEFKYWIDEKVEKTFLENTGKLAIFTDKHDWSAEKIVMTYNRKVFIEDDFHWLKDKLLIPLTPIWHRKDDHIRAHVFMCVMGLFFVRYISYRLGDLGISDEQIFQELSRIRVGLVAHNDLKTPQIVVEDMTPIQARIFTKLDLGRYLRLNNF